MRRWSIGALSPTSRRSISKWFPSVRQSYGDGFTNVTDLSAHDSVISQLVLEEFRSTVTNGTQKFEKRDLLAIQGLNQYTAFAFSLSIVRTPSWQQLQHFDLLFAGAATATVRLLTFWKLAKKWFDYERHSFYMLLFWLRIDRHLVTDQSPLSCNQSPIIHRLVADRSQQIASLSPYIRLTVADRSPINRWQVTKPIAD